MRVQTPGLTTQGHRAIPTPMLIYKILRPAEWAILCRDGESAGAPVDVADGFIHFSTAEQIAETAARHFSEEIDLWVMAVDADGLDDLKWEPSRGGALFPHLYGRLRLSDARWVRRMPMGADGHILPDGIA